jgi:hypothetical protein
MTLFNSTEAAKSKTWWETPVTARQIKNLEDADCVRKLGECGVQVALHSIPFLHGH